MMRLLIIHNHYQDPGGEDLVFQQECELLSESEIIQKLEFQNKKGFAGLLQFLAYPWNLSASSRLDLILKKFNPDLVHIHNLHYASGPLLIRKLHRHNIPVVITLHNYRLLCPSAMLFHHGQLFTSSLKQAFPWKAVRRGVWANSVIKTFWLALTTYLHQRIGTWDEVDRYFVLTDFARKLFTESRLNIPPESFTVKPNFITETQQKPVTGNERGPHYLFVGRLAPEKGLLTLIEAFSQNNRLLRVAGDGPLRQQLIEKSKIHPNITVLGAISATQVREEMARSQALIFPSEWYEGMPMTLIEAFSSGTPVLASRLGAMESMITDGENGLLFEAGNPEDLQQCVERWERLDAITRDEIGRQAYQHYLMKYSPAANKELMLNLYKEIICTHKSVRKK